MKSKRRNDLLIILIPVLLCVGYGIWSHFSHKAGGYVYVEQDGIAIGEYPLNEDAEIRFESPGGGYNTLVIKDGKADITSASCPDGICVKHRRIGYEGESIVCLPNRLIARITKVSRKQALP